MFDWLRKQIRRTELHPLPLTFVMDRTDSDQHIVQVYKHINGRDEPVTHIETIWQYGYQEEQEGEQGTIAYRINEQDRQTLLALRSLNPRIDGDGRLVFPFAPPMLNYLRTKDNLDETESSEKLQVSSKPPQPIAQVDYNPGVDLTVEIGYQVEGTKDVIRPENQRITADGNYMIVENTFVPVPKSQNTTIQEWLKWPKRTIPYQNIPEFFQRDLVLLKKEFTAVLTDLAAQIRIVQTPLTPVIKVDTGERGWLDFDVSYQAGEFTLPHNLLAEHKNELFAQVDEYTWVKNDQKTVQKTEKRLQELEADLTTKGYRAPISQFASLEDFIQNIGGKAELSAAYQAFLSQLTGFQANENFRLSAAAEQQLQKAGITLYPYQRAGIHWLDWLFNNHLHGLLADDMGLGKTLQSISLLHRAYEQTNSRQHSLILAPKSVIHHWKRELDRFFPNIRTYEYHGASRRKDYLNAVEPIIFISTYETITNDLEILKTIPFFYIILDEATRIKNPESKRTQAVKALNSAHRLALSGTPVENRPAI
jgi:hypothetical protein